MLPLTVSRLKPAIEQLATFSAQSDANQQAAEPALSALLNITSLPPAGSSACGTTAWSTARPFRK